MSRDLSAASEAGSPLTPGEGEVVGRSKVDALLVSGSRDDLRAALHELAELPCGPTACRVITALLAAPQPALREDLLVELIRRPRPACTSELLAHLPKAATREEAAEAVLLGYAASCCGAGTSLLRALEARAAELDGRLVLLARERVERRGLARVAAGVLVHQGGASGAANDEARIEERTVMRAHRIGRRSSAPPR